MKKYNAIFLNTIFLQTILTFIAQVIGFKVTIAKRTYKWTSIVFGVLTFLNLLLELMIGIVPTGGMVG